MRGPSTRPDGVTGNHPEADDRSIELTRRDARVLFGSQSWTRFHPMPVSLRPLWICPSPTAAPRARQSVQRVEASSSTGVARTRQGMQRAKNEPRASA